MHHATSSPAKAGDPVFRSASFQPRRRGMLDTPPSRGMTAGTGYYGQLGRDRAALIDHPWLALIVDRDVGKVTLGDQDRVGRLAAKHPCFEADGDRGPADPHQMGVHR